MQVSLLQNIEGTTENSMSLASLLDDPHPIPVPSMMQHARLCRIPTCRAWHSRRTGVTSICILFVLTSWLRHVCGCEGRHSYVPATLPRCQLQQLTICESNNTKRPSSCLWLHPRSNPKTLVLSTKDHTIA